MRDGCGYAGVSDLDKLVEWAREFHQASPFADRRFSPNGARQYLAQFIKGHNAVLIMNETGAIGASWSNSPVFEGKVVNEAFWYGGGLDLFKEYMEWADRLGVCCDVLSVMNNSKVDSKRLLKVLGRWGYEVYETTIVRKGL